MLRTLVTLFMIILNLSNVLFGIYIFLVFSSFDTSFKELLIFFLDGSYVKSSTKYFIFKFKLDFGSSKLNIIFKCILIYYICNK